MFWPESTTCHLKPNPSHATVPLMALGWGKGNDGSQLIELNSWIRRMSGAYSKPMPWAGGGATKPPMANNYLDSHGLNPGTTTTWTAMALTQVQQLPGQPWP